MFKNKKIVYPVIAFVILGLLIFLKMRNPQEARRGIPTPTVVLGVAARADMTNSIQLTGDILPNQQATIYSRVGGNLQKVYADIGDYVKENQLLALIDTTIYAQNVKLAKANYNQADASYLNNKINFERNKKLVEQNLISRQDFDNSQTAMDASLAQKEAASANYQNAITQLSYCKITAPFSGLITKRFLDPGVYIATGGNSVNSSIFVIIANDKLKSLLNIPEKIVPRLSQVKKITLVADALPGQTFLARLTKVSDAIDLSTRTMAVELQIENQGKSLKPGMFATFQLQMDSRSNVLVIPNNLVQKDESGEFVFTVSKDTLASKVYVKTGITENNRVEVISGITETDQIILAGQTLVKDKMKVRISK